MTAVIDSGWSAEALFYPKIDVIGAYLVEETVTDTVIINLESAWLLDFSGH